MVDTGSELARDGPPAAVPAAAAARSQPPVRAEPARQGKANASDTPRTAFGWDTVALIAGLVLAQSIAMVYFKKVSMAMPHGSFLLTQMQPIGCGGAFGIILLVRWAYRRVVGTGPQPTTAAAGAAAASHLQSQVPARPADSPPASQPLLQPGTAAAPSSSVVGMGYGSSYRVDSAVDAGPGDVVTAAMVAEAATSGEPKGQRAGSSHTAIDISIPPPRPHQHQHQHSPEKKFDGTQTPTTGAAWHAYAFVGLCLMAQNFLNRTGSRGTLVPGPMLLLLNQAVVPVTMVASIVFLRKRFRLAHYAGVMLILGGMCLSLIPQMGAMRRGATGWAVLLIALASLPSSAAFVKLELEFRGGRMEVVWGWFIINVWQFFLGLLLILAMPFDDDVSLAQVPSYMADSLRCLFAGENTYANDVCSIAGTTYVMYWVTNTTMNLIVACVLASLGATVSYIAFTAALPVSDLLFATPLLMGSHASSFSGWSIGALVTVVLGLALYRSTKEGDRDEESETAGTATSAKNAKRLH